MRAHLFITFVALTAGMVACTSRPRSEPGSLAGPPAPAETSTNLIACGDIDAEIAATSNATWQAVLEATRGACALDSNDIRLEDAAARLAGKSIALIADGDILTLLQVSASGAPVACCSIQQVNWRDLGDGKTYAARLHLKNLQSAMLTQSGASPASADFSAHMVEWRGPNAPPKPVEKPLLSGAILETTLFSPQLKETRRLSIYQPAASAGSTEKFPVLVLLDGEAVHSFAYMIEPLIDSGEIEPTVVVGLVSGQAGIVEDRSDLGFDIRALDYLFTDYPDQPSRSEAHLAFIADTVLPWAEAEFGATTHREQRVISGFSNGGVFALHAGFRRPDIFGHAWPMSAGINPVTDIPSPSGITSKFRFSAGLYEPGFLANTQVSAQSLAASGYAVDTQWYAAGHMDDQWNVRMLENLKAVFPGPGAKPQ